MRFAALVERTSSGWRAWVPAMPGVEVEARTAAAAEEELVDALQRHVRARWAAEGLAGIPEIRCFSVDVRFRPRNEAQRHLERQGEEERRRMMRRLDGLLADGARLPRELLNAVFAYRRELLDSLPEEDPEEGPPEDEPDEGNVVLFIPREC